MGFIDSMKSENIILFGLHGFLGQGSDFDRIKNLVSENIELIAPNLFSDTEFDLSSFEKCADQIFESMQVRPEKKIFIGYSLGGRIGLHILDRYPNLFQHYIFLSTHSGLIEDSEKNLRLSNDTIWSCKLKELSWSNFLAEWNAQTVFTNSVEPERFESFFNKQQLADALMNLSLAKQKNMQDVLLKNKNKVTWVVGERDQKFLILSEELKQKKILENYSRISSGHRILFDAEMSELLKIILQPLATQVL